GKILVVYLPQAILSTSSVSFLGSLFLHRIYQVGLAREEVREEARTPFYVYADEANLYITSYLRALLQTMRKYKVFFTFATQSLVSFNKTDRTVADTLVAQCDIKVIFRCQPLDADIISRYFPPTSVFRENLTSIPHHQFVAIISGEEGTKFRRCSTFPLPSSLPDPDEVIEVSLSMYGREYDFSRMEVPKRVRVPEPELTPCQYLCLVEIARAGKRGTQEDRVAKALKEKFGFAKVEIFTALRFLANARYVDEVVRYEDEAGRPTPVARYFKVINRAGLEMLYPPLSGARLGGMAHARLLGEMIKECQERGWGYVLSEKGGKELVVVTYKGEDVAEFVTAYPDMLVYPLVERTGEGGVTSYSASVWDIGRRFAVEVELDPLHHGHITRVLAHWRRNEAMGLPTLFVVNSEEKAEGIRRALEEAGATVVRDISKAKAGEVAVKVLEIRPLELAEGSLLEEGLARMVAAARDEGEEEKKGEEGVPGSPPKSAPEPSPAPETSPAPELWREILWGRYGRPEGGSPAPEPPKPEPVPSPPPEPAPEPVLGPESIREPVPRPVPKSSSPEPSPESREPEGGSVLAGRGGKRGRKALDMETVKRRIRKFLREGWVLEKRKDGKVYARRWDPELKKVVRKFICAWSPDLEPFFA
ncbi:MAG: type IV secretory system conjugative DNA transfer family protein, partial [Candidatus Hadarchaeales archaeon]